MLREKVEAALREAVAGNDEPAVRTLRLVRCALNERRSCDKESGRSEQVSDGEVERMLAAMIQQRREQIPRYEEQGQLELARQEEEEIEVISRFLPPVMDEEATLAAVDAALARTGAQKVKDLGRVLTELKAQFAGRMDFGRAKLLLQQRLH